MNELRNIKPTLISLVGKAANKTTVIYKSAEQDNTKQLRVFEIIQKDDEKKLVYGIVYSPDVEDTQGDFATAAEIEKAAHTFMQTLDSTAKVDTGHNLQIAKGVNIVQSYIVNKGDEMYPDNPGAWAIVVKVDNDEVWSQVKDGSLTGFSMYGVAERIVNDEEVTKEDISIIKKAVNLFKSLLNNNSMDDKIKLVKDFNSSVGSREVQDYIWTLGDVIRECMNDENITDKNAAVTENIDQFKAKVESIMAMKSMVAEIMKGDEVDVEKAGKVLSEANLTKLNAAITAINDIITNSKTKTENKVDPNIQKQIDDAVKAAVDIAKGELETAHTAKITELTQTIETQKAEIEELKKETPGSQQQTTEKTTVEKSDGEISYLGLRS